MLGRKARSTFDAAASKNFFARLARVALHKTVLGFALTFVGLIGSFRHVAP